MSNSIYKLFQRLSRFIKNIAVFSLWLAGFVIIVHSFIPHDHHSDCSVFNKENECQADNTRHPVKIPVFPFHCHALNELTFERTPSNIIVNNNIPVCDLFILSFFDSVISVSALSNLRIKGFQKPLIEKKFLLLSPFRAPPVFV